MRAGKFGERISEVECLYYIYVLLESDGLWCGFADAGIKRDVPFINIESYMLVLIQ